MSRPRTKFTDDEALAYLNACASVISSNNAATWPLQRLWFECQAQVLGIQSDADISRVLGFAGGGVDRFDGGEDLIVFNHLFPYVMFMIGRLAQNRGEVDVIPGSADFRDIQAAKVAKAYLSYLWESLDMDTVNSEFALSQVITGNAFLYPKWDPHKGPLVTTYRDPMRDNRRIIPNSTAEEQFLASVGSKDVSPAGDLDLEVVTPFQVRFPDGFKSIADCPWIVVETLRSLDWVWTRYPRKAKDVVPNDFELGQDASSGNVFLQRLSNLVSMTGQTIGGVAARYRTNDQVIVRELWHRPSPRLRAGAYIVATPTMLLENSGNPMVEAGMSDSIPLVHGKFCQVLGRMMAMGPIEHLLGPQAEYNQGRNWARDVRDTFRPQWISPSGGEPDLIARSFGDVIEYKLGGKPELVMPPSLGQAYFETVGRALDDIGRIGARNDTTSGIVPDGVRSGKGLQALTDADLATTTFAVRSKEIAFSKVQSLLLELARKNITEERIIEVYGEDEMLDVRTFKGSDLRNSVRVRVRRESMGPRSKMDARNNVMDLLASGGLNPQDPDDKRIIYRTLDLGVPQSARGRARQRRRAQIEQQIFSTFRINPSSGIVMVWDERHSMNLPAMGPNGDIVPFPDVDEDEDHPVHIEEHRDFKASDVYASLHPIIQMAFDAHLYKHKVEFRKMQQAMMAMAGQPQAGGSAPNPRGEASQPRPQKREERVQV